MNDRTSKPCRAHSPALLFAVLGLLVLCSCSGRQTANCPPGQPGQPAPYASLPPEAFTGAPTPGPMYPPSGPPGMEKGVPLPYMVTGPWAPPGLAQPWPQDEYLADGGDRGSPAGMTKEVQLVGLESEDTVAYYDTLDGRTLVEPSNRVHIYAPRFMSVRQITGAHQDEQMLRYGDVAGPEQVAANGRVQPTGTTKQNIQPERHIGQKSLTTYRTRQGDGVVSVALIPGGVQDALLPFENLAVIRTGAMSQAEMGWLARGTTAAATWEHTQTVQVTISGKAANALVQNRSADTIFVVDQPPGDPKLRIVKVASTQFAEPGETIDFTLRFDNAGNQPLGNVTIVDHLTPRLEYVADSAKANVKATFTTQRGEDDSLILRWDVTDPVQIGKGGVVRFKCRVR